jgi:CDP-4-dehydro-6-deoxyglucose reductase
VKARLLDSHEIAPEVRHFRFEVEGQDTFAFEPGQFVSFSGEVSGRIVTRAYSICSPPEGNRFELCLNRVQEGLFSPYLFEMKPGDAVSMREPLGYFTLRNPQSDMVMVASGTGIAPFRSMIRYWLAHGGSSRCTLIFGVRYAETILYRAEWEGLAAAHRNFAFWPTLSRPHSLWAGRVGHVQAHLMDAAGDRRDLDVYVCGLKAMVDDVRSLLKGVGFDRRRIIYEKYD